MTTLTIREGASIEIGTPATHPLDLAHRSKPRILADIGHTAVHLAAVERVILPAAARRLPDGASRAARMRACGQELCAAMHHLDRHLTGDYVFVQASTERLTQQMQDLADRHGEMERETLSALATTLSDDELLQLCRRYHQTAMKVPTRPHPRLTRRGPLAGLLGRAVGVIDGLRDLVDNRTSVTRSVEAACAQALKDLDAIAEARAER